MRQWAYKLHQQIESRPELRAALRKILPLLSDYDLPHGAPIGSTDEVLEPLVEEVTELLDEIDERDRSREEAGR